MIKCWGDKMNEESLGKYNAFLAKAMVGAFKKVEDRCRKKTLKKVLRWTNEDITNIFDESGAGSVAFVEKLEQEIKKLKEVD